MQLLDIDVNFVKNHLYIEQEWTKDDIEIQFFMDSALSFMEHHSKYTLDELNQIPSSIPYFLKLVTQLYYNREATQQRKADIDAILAQQIKNIRMYNL